MQPESDSPFPLGQRTLFSGHDLYVRSVIVRPDAPLVFTFTARYRGRRLREGFGEKLFSTRDINAVHFIHLKNHWWHTEEMPAAIAAALEMRAALAPPQVATYGYSMGGFGALLFARQLGAATVLAFSPQASVHGDDLPIDPIWTRDLGDTKKIYQLSADCLAGCRVLVGYDPLFDTDIRHVAAVAALHPVEAIRMPLAGHRTPSYLREVGLLSDLVTDVVAGPADWRQLRREVRATRRRSTVYLDSLKRRRPSLALGLRPLIEEAMLSAIGGEGGRMNQRAGERWIDHSCWRLMLNGDADAAIARAQSFLSLFPDSERAAFTLAWLQAHDGRFTEAEAGVDRMIARDPLYVRPFLLRAKILLATGRTAAAEEVTRACIANSAADSGWRPATSRSWRALAVKATDSEMSTQTRLALLRHTAAMIPHDRQIAARLAQVDAEASERGAKRSPQRDAAAGPAPQAPPTLGRTIFGWLTRWSD